MDSIPVESTTMQDRHHPADPLGPSRPMQWVLLGLVTLLTLAVIALPLVSFYATKNLIYFVPTAAVLPLGFMWYRIISYVFPKKKEDYDLQALKIRKAERRGNTGPHLPSHAQYNMWRHGNNGHSRNNGLNRR